MKNVVGKIACFIGACLFIVNAYFFTVVIKVMSMIRKDKPFIPSDGDLPEFIDSILDKQFLYEFINNSEEVVGSRMTKFIISSMRTYIATVQKALMMGKLWQERFDEVYINLNEAERSLLI